MSKPRAALYARVSTLAQDKVDPWASLPRQIEDMRATAKRHGLTVTMEVREAASGAKADRPEWKRILDAARAGEVDVIMAVAFDRLTRSERLGDFEALKDEARSLGLRLVTVKSGEIDLSGSADAETRSDFDAVLAKRERLVIKERTMRGRRAKGEAGGYTGHHPPYGYQTAFNGKTGEKTFPIDEAAAAVVRKLFADFVAGARVSQLARDLNSAGVPAPGKWGRGSDFWHVRTVRLMVGNPTYAGLSSWHRGKEPPVPSKVFEPLVPLDLWEAAQQEISVRAVRGARGSGRPHPLSGILRCQTCSAGMLFQRGAMRKQGFRNQSIYECGNRDSRNRKPCAGAQYLNAKSAEATVLSYLRERLPAYVNDERVAAAANKRDRATPDRLPALEKRVADIKGKQSRVLDFLLDPDKAHMHPELEAKLAELRDQLREAEAKLAEAKRQLQATTAARKNVTAMRSIAEMLDRWPEDEDRLRQLFDAAILEVVLAKTSAPRTRQVLAVERLKLRNGDWL